MHMWGWNRDVCGTTFFVIHQDLVQMQISLVALQIYFNIFGHISHSVEFVWVLDSQNVWRFRDPRRYYPANIRLDEDVLKTSFVFVFRRRLQDVLIKTNIFTLLIRLQDVFKKSWWRPIYSSWLCVFKTSSRRFQDVFNTSSRRIIKLNCST